MYSIDNITVKEYLQLVDTSDYDIFIDTLEPINSFNGHTTNVHALSFDNVKIVKDIFLSPSIDNIKDMFIDLFKLGSYEVSAENEYYNTSIFDLFKAKKFIQDWIVSVIERENKVLAGIPDEKLIMLNAGERLKAVSHLLTKMKLAEQLNMTPSEIGHTKYMIVFSWMYANKQNNDIQMEYSKLK